jgi:hypothetical protein
MDWFLGEQSVWGVKLSINTNIVSNLKHRPEVLSTFPTNVYAFMVPCFDTATILPLDSRIPVVSATL